MARHLAPAPSVDMFDGVSGTTSLVATLLANSYRAVDGDAVAVLDVYGDLLTADDAASLADEHSTSLYRLADDEALRPTVGGMFWTVDVLLALGY
jgi:hypothetical protein